MALLTIASVHIDAMHLCGLRVGLSTHHLGGDDAVNAVANGDDLLHGEAE